MTMTVDRRQEPAWAVWIHRNGAGYKLPFKVSGETEQEATQNAEECVNRVLDGVGVSYLRGSDYTVQVRLLIE